MLQRSLLLLRPSPAAPCGPWLSVAVRGLKRPPVNTSQLKEGRRTGALAMKVGMLAVFDKWGRRYPCTALQLDACQVVQVKTTATDGYDALQLGVGEAKLKRVKISALGHYGMNPSASKSASALEPIAPKRLLGEFRVSPDMLLPRGTRISARHFVPGQLVDVAGITKGKGFQGVMKKWNFGGGRASHGASLSHRIPGATGQRQDPGRVFKGKKMPGRMGSERVTVQNLKVLKIDTARDVVYVIGAVPGSPGTFVRIVDAVKGPFFPEGSPVPRPTYLPVSPQSSSSSSGQAAGAVAAGEVETEIFMPMPEGDALKDVEHPNPEQY